MDVGSRWSQERSVGGYNLRIAGIAGRDTPTDWSWWLTQVGSGYGLPIASGVCGTERDAKRAAEDALIDYFVAVASKIREGRHDG
jgi:hypothetical protein